MGEKLHCKPSCLWVETRAQQTSRNKKGALFVKLFTRAPLLPMIELKSLTNRKYPRENPQKTAPFEGVSDLRLAFLMDDAPP